MSDVDRASASVLERFRFDAALFNRIQQSVAQRQPLPGSERVSGTIAPPGPGDLVTLPASSSAEGQALARAGLECLTRGEVGIVVLAGGMATRFGGVVKAVVEVFPGFSFLRLKMEEIARVASTIRRPLPVILMTSFATSDEIRRAIRSLIRPDLPIHIVEQSVSMRLTPAGEVFNDALGRPSLCSTGHGDLLPTLRSSGALAKFRGSGGRRLMVSNVDNLAATVDPRVIGAHCRGGKSVTVEVVEKEQGDRGGIPVWVEGRLQIVEEFRLPPTFDESRVPYFNTNTFVLEADALDQELNLSWFTVRRKVDGREAIQAERLLGQVTAFLPTQYLIVDRHGPDGRFLPVKDQDDLELRKAEIRALFKDRDIRLTAEMPSVASA